MSTLKQTAREMIRDDMRVTRTGLGKAFIGSLGWFVVGYAGVGIANLLMLGSGVSPESAWQAAPLYALFGFTVIGAYLMISMAFLGLYGGWNFGALVVLWVGFAVVWMTKHRVAFSDYEKTWPDMQPLDPFVIWKKQPTR